MDWQYAGGPVVDDIPSPDAYTPAPAYVKGEAPAVRLAYLQAVYNNVHNKLSVRDCSENLAAILDSLELAGVLPDDPRPARTLAGAKSRLGIDPDEEIIQYAVCPICWKLYAPWRMRELPSPACLVPGCAGEIYDESRDSKGVVRRTAKLIMPHVSLIQRLRRIVRRKGFRKLVRDSRGTPVGQNEDPHFLMNDMHDAQAWHQSETGIQRERGEHGAIRDSTAPGRERVSLTNHRFGLHLTWNLDW